MVSVRGGRMSDKEMARCLLEFGKFYHLLKENSENPSTEEIITIHELLDVVEDECNMYLGDIEPNIFSAYNNLAFRDRPEESKRELLAALMRLEEHLGLTAGYYY